MEGSENRKVDGEKYNIQVIIEDKMRGKYMTLTHPEHMWHFFHYAFLTNYNASFKMSNP